MIAQAGRVVLVTGGCGGIGHATALRLLGDGASVVLADLAPPEGPQAVALAPFAGQVLFCGCDVTRRAEVAAAVTAAQARFGRLDGLVTAAGVDRRHRLAELDDEEFAAILDVNLLGSFRAAQLAAAVMGDRPAGGGPGGAIVLVSSVNARIGTATHTAYGASKGAIAQMTRIMAVELAPRGIRVNAVGPGTVRTRMLDDLAARRPEALERLLLRTPMGRFAEPAEIAAAVSFLLSDDASYITGQTLYVDGGRLAQNMPG